MIQQPKKANKTFGHLVLKYLILTTIIIQASLPCIAYIFWSNKTNNYNFIEPNLEEHLHPLCFERVPKGDYNFTNCFNRTTKIEYLSCHFGFSPLEVDKPRINIFNSRSMLGIAVKGQFEKNNFRISEAKSEYHTDLLSPPFAVPLNMFNILAHIVIEPVYDACDLLFNLTAPVIIVTSTNDTFPDNITDLHVIRIPKVYGPDFPYPFVQMTPSSIIQQCVISPWNLKKKIEINENEEFAFSGDISVEIVRIVKDILNGKDETPVSVPKTSFGSILTTFSSFSSDCKFLPYGGLYDSEVRGKVKLIYEWYKKFLVKAPQDKVYLSWVTTVCDLKRVVDRANAQIQYFSEFLRRMPSLSIEFVYVYAKLYKNSSSFEELFTIPEPIKQHLTVIELSSVEVANLNTQWWIDTFPEFKLRNIGIRRAKGEYIISGSSDVLPCYSMFDHCMRRLFSPGLYRSNKYEGGDPIPRNFDDFIVFNTIPEAWITTFNKVNNYTDIMSYLLTKSSGDFQGCHRTQWHMMHGYLETGQTLHVDSWMLMEFSGYIMPLVVHRIGSHVHLAHIKVSQRSYPIDTSIFIYKGLICSGTFSHEVAEFSRPNWGIIPPQSSLNMSKSYTVILPHEGEEELNISWTFDYLHLHTNRKTTDFDYHAFKFEIQRL